MLAVILCRIFCLRLLSKNVKIKIYRIIIVAVVLYGCETWSPTVTEERRLRVFEIGVLRKIFGPLSSMICTAHQILFWRSNREELYGRGMLHAWEREEIRTGFRWGDLRERNHCERLCLDKLTLKWSFKKMERHGVDLSG
jgi:hypothetical protein